MGSLISQLESIYPSDDVFCLGVLPAPQSVRVVEYLIPDYIKLKRRLMALTTEECHFVFHSADHDRPIGSIAFSGLEDRVIPDLRMVFQRAMDDGAVAMCMVHNHPSGCPNPSRADINLTRRIAFVAKLLDIKLYDHIIVSSAGVFSFRADGLL
jgi:DNA repair protein RadC